MGKVLGTIGQVGLGYGGSAIFASAFGASLGPLGFAVGTLLGGAIFGPNRPTPKPSRLEDLNVQGSEYGSLIPVFYGGTLADGTHGGVPTTGQIIDADPRGGIEEIAVKSSVRGGTGKTKKKTVTEYAYFLTVAILFGEGPLQIDKFWADEKLLYDRYASTEKARGWKFTTENSTGSQIGDKARFYPGNFKQLPDTALASFHGGVVPAYRGCCYAVILKYPLADHQNRIPTFRALVTNGVTQRREMVRQHLVRAGIPVERVSLTQISGEQLGAFQTSQGGGRDFVESLCAISLCEIGEWDGKVRDVSKTDFLEMDADSNDLCAQQAGSDSDRPDLISIQINQDDAIPSASNLRFMDYDNKFEPNVAVGLAQFGEGDRHTNELTLELPVVGRLPDLSPLAQIIIDEAVAARYPYEVVALPKSKYATRIPGNVINVPTPTGNKRMKVTGTSIGCPGPVQFSGHSFDPKVYGNHRVVTFPTKPPVEVEFFDTPRVFVFDTVAFADDMARSAGVLISAGPPSAGAAYAGAVVEIPALGDDGTITIYGKATQGQTLNTLPDWPDNQIWPGPLNVKLDFGGLESIENFDSNTNIAIVGKSIIRFQNAVEVAPLQYELRNILIGQAGSDYLGQVNTGAPFLLLADDLGAQSGGLTYVEVPLYQRGKNLAYTVSPARYEAEVTTGFSAFFTANSLIPLSPAPLVGKVEEGELRLSWASRSRYANEDYFGTGNFVESDPFLFLVTTSRAGVSRTWESQNNTLDINLADVPGTSNSIVVTVSQRSQTLGMWGRTASITMAI